MIILNVITKSHIAYCTDEIPVWKDNRSGWEQMNEELPKDHEYVIVKRDGTAITYYGDYSVKVTSPDELSSTRYYPNGGRVSIDEHPDGDVTVYDIKLPQDVIEYVDAQGNPIDGNDTSSENSNTEDNPSDPSFENSNAPAPEPNDTNSDQGDGSSTLHDESESISSHKDIVAKRIEDTDWVWVDNHIGGWEWPNARDLNEAWAFTPISVEYRLWILLELGKNENNVDSTSTNSVSSSISSSSHSTSPANSESNNNSYVDNSESENVTNPSGDNSDIDHSDNASDASADNSSDSSDKPIDYTDDAISLVYDYYDKVIALEQLSGATAEETIYQGVKYMHALVPQNTLPTVYDDMEDDTHISRQWLIKIITDESIVKASSPYILNHFINAYNTLCLLNIDGCSIEDETTVYETFIAIQSTNE
jgi:hypothetical protein